MIPKKYFYDNFFFFLVLFSVAVLAVILANRFLIKQDYLVSYEGECDASINNCFVGCEDDECTKEYYYTKVEKYAPDLYRECGSDITDCAEASICLPSDRVCFVRYCNLEIEGDACESLFNSTTTQEAGVVISTDDNLLES